MCDQLDPRVHRELERLNEASNVINRLENKLSETRNQYRTALSESTHQLNSLAKKLGDCVTKARPFYDAKQVAKEAQLETQHAAVRFERAVSMHVAAREMVAVAEQGMENGGDTTDTAWQEMLNHATLKVNDAELERIASGEEHQEKMELFKKAESNMNALQKKLKFNIMKSRKYFEFKEQTNARIEALVALVKSAEAQLSKAKIDYSQALRSLENISNSIHEARKSLGERGAGVGAEDEPVLQESEAELKIEAITQFSSKIEDDETSITMETVKNNNGKEAKVILSSKLTRSKTSEILLSVADLNRVQIK
ncbi:SH3 domain-binding protein 5-like [Styela clava]|uniref:SH3 domain-binding protein 5-like n=1 Tax=Styela clava TaxID=7725 RepID=UPI0019396B2E|nr:SH3 domain-binding protein 5-like [Styela clava]